VFDLSPVVLLMVNISRFVKKDKQIFKSGAWFGMIIHQRADPTVSRQRQSRGVAPDGSAAAQPSANPVNGRACRSRSAVQQAVYFSVNRMVGVVCVRRSVAGTVIGVGKRGAVGIGIQLEDLTPGPQIGCADHFPRFLPGAADADTDSGPKRDTLPYFITTSNE
jgi:hypothetical protein